MLLGTNYHPVHKVPVATVAQSGAKLVRYPMWDNYTQFTNSMIKRGIEPIVVLDHSTLYRSDDPQGRLKELLLRYPDVKYWQVGNEPDQPDSPSSWYMTPAEYNELLGWATPMIRRWGHEVLGAGLVSGNPSYLDSVDLSLVDVIAVHPYGQAPSNWPSWGVGRVDDLIYGYAGLGKPLWVTEFGGQSALFDDEHQRAVYHTDMIRSLADLGIETAVQFCLTSRMVPGFGMLDEDNMPLETWAAFVSASS